MLSGIAEEARATAIYTGRPLFSNQVMTALASVPRHKFVPETLKRQAYINSPLPIGCGQTISQPYIVALMTDLLDIENGEAVVLEVGTGCGYQTAVLAEIAKQVYSIEIIDELAEQATLRMKDLGYANVAIKSGDGYQGWPEHAPYDGILVTAAAIETPITLIQQLKPGGRLVIPVGSQGTAQDLMLVEKGDDGSVTQRPILPVAFVPFRRSSLTAAV
ncbi:MAG: protein-L-isoaspartate(D-aspartate) O-methyltransferase [Gammaproteobacteria bacterium]|nr:protein-L-isoaspartate(D-aspartate) O-methyltransferase [Gammaproteobacteria bacterium]